MPAFPARVAEKRWTHRETVCGRASAAAGALANLGITNPFSCSTPLVRLYTWKHAQPGSPGFLAAILGLFIVSSIAGAGRTKSPRRPRHLRGHADRRRKIALLSITRSCAGQNCHRHLTADRTHAGPGDAPCAHGNSRSGAQQHAGFSGAIARDDAGAGG